jgi:hypothetical protein
VKAAYGLKGEVRKTLSEDSKGRDILGDRTVNGIVTAHTITFIGETGSPGPFNIKMWNMDIWGLSGSDYRPVRRITVTRVRTFLLHRSTGCLLTSWATGSFSRRSFLYWISCMVINDKEDDKIETWKSADDSVGMWSVTGNPCIVTEWENIKLS